MKTIHDYVLPSLDGGELKFSDFAGKKILVVNVASACGYTPQYTQLQELYDNFKDKIVVVGCPCNDFGAQEQGSDSEIAQFCAVRYGVTFPMTTKIGITTNTHPLYQFLTQQSENGLQDSKVKWNFQKYVLDENGRLSHVFPSAASPLDEAVLTALGLS